MSATHYFSDGMPSDDESTSPCSSASFEHENMDTEKFHQVKKATPVEANDIPEKSEKTYNSL